MTVAQLADWLPAIEDARRWSQSMAVLDAIAEAEEGLRYFRFDSQLGPGQAQASMDNGGGDNYSITFTGGGAMVLGFAHETQLSPFGLNPPAPWPGLFTGLPAALAKMIPQSAHILDGVPLVTVALWRLAEDEQWRHGPVEYPPDWEHHYDGDPDGSGWLFEELDGRPGTYLGYASAYFERQLPADAVTAIFEHQPVTVDLVRALNPERVLGGLVDDLIWDDLNRIGYPAR